MDTDALFEELYRDLRRIASARMRGERAGHTLQTTALLSEAYLRLAHTDAARWTDRQHFLRTAARVMRRILIDHGRKHSRRVRLASALETECGIASDGIEFLHVHRAIDELATEHPRQAQVVEFRYILGVPLEEVAQVLGVSSRTVTDDARLGVAWIRRHLARHVPVPKA